MLNESKTYLKPQSNDYFVTFAIRMENDVKMGKGKAASMQRRGSPLGKERIWL